MNKSTNEKLIFVYILKCAKGKYYVGRTTRIAARLFEHWEGRGSEWTTLYPPINVERVIETHSTYEEGNYVKEYMHIHGIDNVRGGAYVTKTLTPDQINLINKEIREAKNLCMICGSAKHFCNSCPSKARGSPKPQARGSPKPQYRKVSTEVIITKEPATSKPQTRGSPKPQSGELPKRKSIPKSTEAINTKVTEPIAPIKKVYNRHRSPTPSSMVGKLWTTEEESTLRREYDEGYDIETIASYHERTQKAIEMKLLSLGYDV